MGWVNNNLQKFKKGGRSGWLHKSKEGKIDPFGIQEKLLGD